MPIDPKNLALRIIVSIVGIPAILLATWQGGWWWGGFLMLLAFIGFWEYARLVKLPHFLLFLGWVLGMGYLYFLVLGKEGYLNHFYVAAFLLTAAFLVLRRKVERAIPDAALFLLGLMYLPVLLGFAIKLEPMLQTFAPEVTIRFGGEGLFQVEEKYGGSWFLIFLWAVIWTTDTAAYFVGAKLGRSHPFETISPKKTTEGFLGGFAGAVLVAVIFFLTKKLNLSFGLTAGLAMTIAFFGQLGDLFESLLKRNFEAKDSSNLIAGHGGVLDRFDSFLFALPAAYLFLIIFS